NHEVEVSNLMFNKTSDEQINFKKYDINVDLEEESSSEGKTILKYSLDLTSNPKNSVINISGSTILSGEQEEIEDFLKQENEKTPEVVSLIYQELFPLMYIVTKNMKIPAPSHTISQSQIMEPENTNERITNDVQSSKEEATEVTESSETNSVSDSSESNLEKDDQKENNLSEVNKS
ncbi:MAG: hypothetical protein ACO2Y0_08850, partial [Nitrosopumilaceae archaeon]